MLAHTLEHTVAPAEAGATVIALALALAGTTGEQVVAHGGAWLNGRRVPGTERVTSGATLALHLPPNDAYPELVLTPADFAYEDTWLVALHKRAGWYVGATPWDQHGNVLAALARYLLFRDGVTPPLHLAHQLDRDTTGYCCAVKPPPPTPRSKLRLPDGG